MNGTQNAVTATPGKASNRTVAGLDSRQSLPARIINWALSAHLLALPHNDVTIPCSSTEDTLLLVEANSIDLVVEELALEGALIHRQMVVFISLDVEETNDTFTRYSCHQTLTNPDGIEEFRVTSDSELDFAIRYELFG